MSLFSRPARRTEAQRIVIVGGGAGGIELATRLSKTSPQDHITLVDRNRSHLWKPLLHEVAAGTLHSHYENVPYLQQARRYHFDFRLGELRDIDREQQTITLAPVINPAGREILPAQTIAYDRLILAIGSKANDFGTPGAKQHCHYIDSRWGAEQFHTALREAIVKLENDPQLGLNIAVVGGGATGVELCAEITRMVSEAAEYGFHQAKKQLNIYLIDSNKRVLSVMHEDVSLAAQKTLRELGVNIVLGARVVAVDEYSVQLKNGDILPATVKAWAAGIRASKILSRFGLEHNNANQIIVNPRLQSVSDPNIYAIGDCASLILPGTEKAVPATAQAAHQQASYLSRALTQIAPKDFEYRYMGSLVSLADYNAVGRLSQLGIIPGGFVSGSLAKLSYNGLYRLHQLALHGYRRAFLMFLSDQLLKLTRSKIRLE